MAVGAAVAAVTRARALIAGLQRELQRSQLGFPAEFLRKHLVQGNIGEEVAPFLPERPGDRAGQILGGTAAVHGAALGGQPVDVLGQTGDHVEPITKRLERLEDRLEVEPDTVRRRRPGVDHHTVRHVDDAEPLDRPRGGAAQGRQGGHHPIEQRQRHRRPQTAQDRAARDGFLGDDHDSDLRI